MGEPRRDDATSADPTVQVGPPPVPGRAVRAQLAAGELETPPVRQDEPTVTLDGPPPGSPHDTVESVPPAPVHVTVGQRPRPRRRWRTWPWIAAVVIALVVLGMVLLVMLWRPASFSERVDPVGLHVVVTGHLTG
jgi:hypothetical protein